MAVALSVLLVLSVLAIAFGTLGISNLHQVRQAEAKVALLHAANGGLSELMDQLHSDTTHGAGVTDDSADGEGTFQTSQGTAYYWWSFDPASSSGYCVNNLGSASSRAGFQGQVVPPLTALLVVNADFVPRNASDDPIRVSAVASKKFRFAVATDGEMETRNVRGVSGFPGSVWSNDGGGDAIDATSIDGQAFSNGDPGSIQVSGSPAGVPYYNAGTQEIPDIPVQDVVASYGSGASTHPYGGPAFYQASGDVTFSTLSDGTIQVSSGTVRGDFGAGAPVATIAPAPTGGPDIEIYVPGEVTFGGSATVAPRLNLFVEDDLRVNGSLSQLPGGESFLFVGGSVRFNGGQASNLHILTGTGVAQNGSATYRGVVYVRDGDFEISGGGTGSSYEGAVLVRGDGSNEGDLDAKNANFTYNPELVTALERFNVSFSENTPVYAVAWWADR